MKEEIAKQWVAALRSGEYEQGEAYLTADGRDCCLGVLCKLYGGRSRLETRCDERKVVVYGSDSTQELPASVRKWSGMRSADGYRHGGSLACLNDNGKTFAEIADIIEAEWRAL